MFRQYLGVWRLPGAPVLVIAGIVGRLGIGMTPLALLLVVERVTGRYALAAVAGGLYALTGAAIGPVAGRLADRIGPAPVLLATAVAHPLALVGLLAATRAGSGNLPLIFLMAAVAGGTYPPLTAALRGAWTRLTAPGSGRSDLRNAALAAETALFELVFVLGPLLVAALVGLADAAAALLGSAIVTLVGTGVAALGRVLRDWRPPATQVRTRGLGPLRVTGFPALLVCFSGLGIAFGAAGVAVPAYSDQHTTTGDADSLAGVLLGIWGIGSAIAGIWFGTRSPASNAVRQFAWLLGAVAASFVAYAVMPNPMALGAALLVGGAAIAPALIVQNTMVGRVAPAGMVTEAYTWSVTTAVASSAAGAAGAGLLVDQFGVPWAFLFAALAVTVAAVVAARPGGSIARAAAEEAETLSRPSTTEPASSAR